VCSKHAYNDDNNNNNNNDDRKLFFPIVGCDDVQLRARIKENE